MNALRQAIIAGWNAMRDTWRSSSGNPGVEYRFKPGDLVRVSGPEHEDFEATIGERLWDDESYRLSNGWIVPGNRLAHVKAVPPWRITGKDGS